VPHVRLDVPTPPSDGQCLWWCSIFFSVTSQVYAPDKAVMLRVSSLQDNWPGQAACNCNSVAALVLCALMCFLGMMCAAQKLTPNLLSRLATLGQISIAHEEMTTGSSSAQELAQVKAEATCAFGELPGRWEWEKDDFYLWKPDTSNRSCCNFEQYLHYEFLTDNFVKQFRGKSIFVIGDSLDRNAVNYFCCRYMVDGGPCLIQWRTSYNNIQYKYCNLHGITVGLFFNVGILDAPYTGQSYYPNGTLCCDLKDSLHDRITKQAAAFRDIALDGKDPSLVLMQSHLWDFAHPEWRDDEEHWSVWFSRAKAFVSMVHETFPTSHVVWRTAGPIYPKAERFNATSLAMTDAFVRKAAQEIKVEIIDYHNILTTDGAETENLKKDIHPDMSGRAALINVAFNILADVSGLARNCTEWEKTNSIDTTNIIPMR